MMERRLLIRSITQPGGNRGLLDPWKVVRRMTQRRLPIRSMTRQGGNRGLLFLVVDLLLLILFLVVHLLLLLLFLLLVVILLFPLVLRVFNEQVRLFLLMQGQLDPLKVGASTCRKMMHIAPLIDEFKADPDDRAIES
jgi:hypothetical protein